MPGEKIIRNKSHGLQKLLCTIPVVITGVRSGILNVMSVVHIKIVVLKCNVY